MAFNNASSKETKHINEDFHWNFKQFSKSLHFSLSNDRESSKHSRMLDGTFFCNIYLLPKHFFWNKSSIYI